MYNELKHYGVLGYEMGRLKESIQSIFESGKEEEPIR